MRLFEFLVLTVLALALIRPLFLRGRRLRWVAFLPGLAAFFGVIHLLVEGHRWQMVPVYALAVLLFALSIVRFRRAASLTDAAALHGHRILVAVGSASGLLCLVGVAALLVAFPVFRLPEPTGPFAVGTTRLHLVDSARSETFTADPDDRRELLVQVWYPAEMAPGARPGAYWESAPFLLNQLALVETHSYPDAPFANAQSPFPVLIFSHGYLLGYVSQNTVQMEELASHGYVVFSIAHPYGALVVTYPDGRRVLFSEDRLWAALDVLTEQAAATSLIDESLRIWTADTIFVMDELERMNAGERASVFTGRLDLARLGVFGMSFGGATAGQVCLVDSRCRAGINLDGSQFGDLHDRAIERPFMVMYDEATEGMNDFVYEQARDAVYRITVKGSLHTDFTDMALMSPFLKRVGIFGPIDGQRVVRILNDYTLAFFDQHLKGKEVPLLDGPSPDYPEVDFESRND
jgi:predicted dienelactone hydrolase